MNLIRRDVGYTIVSRFEEAFRQFLTDKLPIHFMNFEKGIPSGIVEKVKKRISQNGSDEADDFLENTDFSDLPEIICFNGMYNIYFPDVKISQSEFQSLMVDLYELRCKIAHVRQYFTSIDLDKLSEISKLIAPNLGVFGQEFLTFMQELNENPEKVVIPTPVEFLCDSDPILATIPNNVPTPDYEFEGGFVGRDDDIRRVLNLLDGDLHRVITISGAGGVGKTALALQIVYKYLKKGNYSPFDGIIWLSAKETKLSYLGIEDIEPTIKSYEQLLDTIMGVMGFEQLDNAIEEKETDVKTLFDLHNCILIVIDNLETIRDESIINFILDAHPKTKILITSRTGLGQVERRYELKQLKEKEALSLFRFISRDKRLDSLLVLDDDTIKGYIRKVACFPLAIKWVIGQVAIGKDINSVVSSISETTSDISRFCFEQIYNDLSLFAKKLLCTLSMFDEPPSSGILDYVLNIPHQDFEDSIRELILVSLVIPEQYKTEQNEIASRYALLSLTRGDVRQQLDKDPILKRDILERLQTVQTVVEEAERAKKQYRFSLFNLGATTEEEKIAAMIAQTAFQKYQTGRYAYAVEDYKHAIKIAPRFASIYRNWAVMESQEGHSVEADQLMKKATELSPNDPQIWLTWGNIKRKEDKVKDALSKYEYAYKLSPEDGVVLNSLGQAKARLGEYEEADRLFRLAIQKKAPGDTVRHKIINLSSLADNLTSWADSLETGRDYKTAQEKLKEALDMCNQVIELDKSDTKSQDIFRHTLISLAFLYRRMGEDTLAISCFRQAIVNKPVRLMRYREAKDTATAALHAAKILYKTGETEQAKEIFSPDLRHIREPLRSHPKLQDEFVSFWNELYNTPSAIKGKIIRVDTNRRFVIIESLASPGLTFLGYINNFETQPDQISLSMLDKAVSFVSTETNTTSGIRKEAKAIKFI
jgi:tetratricopeptide (TPR) repeat protein/GTPase SAR1 family protein